MSGNSLVIAPNIFVSLASPAFSVTQPAPRNVLGPSKLKFVKTGTSSQTLRLGSAGSAGSAGPKKGEQAQPVWNKNLRNYPSNNEEFVAEFINSD